MPETPEMPEMTDDAGIEHLTPELFVDLLEGAPVAADRRQHADHCARCREELAEISATLARLRSADRGDSVVLAAVTGSSRSIAPSRLRRYVPWLSAAALLLLALLLVRDRGRLAYVARDARDARDERHEGDISALSEADALLPSMDEDADFQILRTLSEEIGGEALFDDVYDSGTIPPDVIELTPAERRNLLGRLAQDLNTRS